MADPQHHHQQQLIHPKEPASEARDVESIFQKGPTRTQVAVVATLLPVGAGLLLLAGLTLTGTLITLMVTAPLFLIFSPILVPATLLIAFAVMGFVASGAFGVVALSAISWLVNFLRGVRVGTLTEQADRAKLKAQEAAGYVGQKTKEFGQTIQSTADAEGGKADQEGGAKSATTTT